MFYHAYMLVHVSQCSMKLHPLELVAAARMAASVKKTAVIAELTDVGDVRFLCLTTQLNGPGTASSGRSGRYARKRSASTFS